MEPESELQKLFSPQKVESPTVVLFRDFEGNHVWFDKDWNHRNLERWIVRNAIPSLVFNYTGDHAYHVFQHNHPILLLLRRETDHGHVERQFQEIANRVRTDPNFEEIIFAVADYDKNTMSLA